MMLLLTLVALGFAASLALSIRSLWRDLKGYEEIMRHELERDE